jgi:phthalate 4,5-cis-dihydrodiol dehydrogenase
MAGEGTLPGIGLIGAGDFGRQHARALRDLEGARLVAASARGPERLAAFTAEFGGTGHPDYRELLHDPAVDAVCIALPHQIHAEAAIAAAEAGKAILLEKPMAPGVAECDAIIAAVARAGVPFMVGHNYRFTPAYQLAKRLVEGGEIGTPILCTAAMVKDWGYAKRQPWHLVEGGGMWLTNGIHLVDRLSWLIGALPSDVRAHVGTHFHDQQADDLGAALITFDSGAVALVRAVAYRAGGQDHWTEIQGTDGALRVSHAQGVLLGRDDRWRAVSRPDPDWMLTCLRQEWGAFLDYLRDGGAAPVPAGYARRMVATIAAGRESSATGRVVRVAGG